MSFGRSWTFSWLVAGILWAGAGAAVEEPSYLGSESCRACHAEIFEKWQGSLHAWAMKPADAAGALAAFDGETHGVDVGDVVSPIRLGGKRSMKLAGTQPGLQEFELPYFLGHGSLEQYLATFEGGRLQALPVAWDVREEEWFHLFPGENRVPEEWGHWTNRGMNANSECLFCHTTGYRKNYEVSSDAFRTKWAEIGVGCEACHGPGQGHPVTGAGASTPDPYASAAHDMTSMDRCAPCHSRRSELVADVAPGQRFLDSYDPELLDRMALEATGQIGEQEVFEWTSFLQSRMYAKGVGCRDCHDVHTAGLKAEGNALCRTCHEPRLAESSHSHHEAEGTGAQCVACHMPERLYMERDPRRDHSMSVPDPELAAELGIPDACTECHKGKTQEWAAASVAEWKESGPPGWQERDAERRAEAMTIAMGRAGDPRSVPGLAAMLKGEGDAIHRASAARLLEPFTQNERVVGLLVEQAKDADPLVRAGALSSLAFARHSAPVERALLEAVRDEVRLVRLHAAFGLRDWQPAEGQDDAAVKAALAEWEAAARSTIERPVSLHNLGNFLTARGRGDEALAAYRRAVRFEPAAVAPRHNLAMFLAGQGRLDEAEAEFKAVLRHNPDAAATAFTLGLLYGQSSRWRDAAQAFGQCVTHDPSYPRAHYNLGLAYSKMGNMKSSLENLEIAASVPGSRASAAQVLADVYRQLGEPEKAGEWAARAAERDGQE